jgi:hypothetical protein
MVPPEALRVEAAPDGPVEVIWREFFGHAERLTLRLATGRVLQARLAGDVSYRPGDRVALRVAGRVPAFPARPGNAATTVPAGTAGRG